MRRFALWVVLAAVPLCLGACRRQPPPADSGNRIATLEQSLERQRNAEFLVADVEAWIVRASSTAALSERERVEGLVRDLAGRLRRVKPGLEEGAAADDVALLREISDLRNAYGRAIASVASERRAAEQAMAETLEDVSLRIARFRVDVASAGVRANAEVRRRMTSLEHSRREAAHTLAEIRRSGVEQWAWLQRRWQDQIRKFDEDHRAAVERVRLMTPAVSPGSAPASENIGARSR